MIRKHLRLKRLVLGTAVGLAIAAISAPAVLAKPISGNGPLDPWAYSLVHQPTDGNGPLDPWAYSLIHRSAQATPASYSAVSGPLGVAAYQSFARITPKGESVTSQSGFNWGDAGIGASVAFGALLLLLLTVVALGRRYRPRITRSGFATS
jgi:hypothetical protein